MTSATQAYSYAAPLLSRRRATRAFHVRRTGPFRSGRWLPNSSVVSSPRRRPRAAALLGVADVALARYHQAQARPSWVRDPVVTCNGDRLRFESFSACGGVYARLDLLGGALDGEVFDRGTTNVDVNPPLREALARVGRA